MWGTVTGRYQSLALSRPSSAYTRHFAGEAWIKRLFRGTTVHHSSLSFKFDPQFRKEKFMNTGNYPIYIHTGAPDKREMCKWYTNALEEFKNMKSREVPFLQSL